MGDQPMTLEEAVKWADLPYHERCKVAEQFGGPRLQDQSDYIADKNEFAYRALMAHARAALAQRREGVTEAMVEAAARVLFRQLAEENYALIHPDDLKVTREALTAALAASGDSALGVLSAGPAQEQLLAAIPNTVVQRNLESRVLDIHVNTRTPAMRLQAVRAAVLGMIDAQIVRYAASGDDDVTPFANTVFSPSDPGYFNPGRPRPSAEAVEGLLFSAGYRRMPAAPRVPPAPEPTPAPTDPSATGAPPTPATKPPAPPSAFEHVPMTTSARPSRPSAAKAPRPAPRTPVA